MTQVFLSHSTIDAEFALKLATDLRAAGVPVWKAPESILDGEEWVAAIQRGIATSTHMLLLKSPAAVQSKWVNFEFNAALSLERQGKMRIIPIDYQPCSPPLFWTLFQHVSGIQDEYHAALFKILAKVRQEQPDHPPAPTDAATTINVTVQGDVSGQVVVAGQNINYAGQPSEPPATQVTVPKPAEPTKPTILDILPPPFEWVDIPAGQVTLEDGMGTHRVEAFQMAKYAITNAQFQVFVDAEDGYQNVQWWHYSRSAMKWRKNNTWPYNPAFGGIVDHPRVNVSWFEVVAFCRWLTARTQSVWAPGQAPDWEIRLPTEQEWQRAGQGDDGRTYAWGDEEPDEWLANWNEIVRRTTPVDSYPLQAERSTYGLFNMTGNVWEWCLTDYDTGANIISENLEQCVLRGGSWGVLSRRNLRLACRNNNLPHRQNSYYGYRVSRSYNP